MSRTGSDPAVTADVIELHGQRVSYRTCGDAGPVVILLHGIAGGSDVWDAVLPRIGAHARVIAPDLLGHGESAKPRIADYSLGAYASGVRDLMVALGYESATIVGHSLGGGVALQFAYQFPERTERLALVSSGGLGREVHPLLRAMALPGAEHVLPLVASEPVRKAGTAVLGALSAVGVRQARDLLESWSHLDRLADAETRRAFVHTVRAVIEYGGQRVSAVNRLYLAREIPILLVAGDADSVIPAVHSEEAHALLPHSRLAMLAGAGHFPHQDAPEEFTAHLLEFLADTPPASVDAGQLRELLVQP